MKIVLSLGQLFFSACLNSCMLKFIDVNILAWIKILTKNSCASGRMYSLGEVNFIQGMLDFGNPKNSVGLKPIAVRLRQTGAF